MVMASRYSNGRPFPHAMKKRLKRMAVGSVILLTVAVCLGLALSLVARRLSLRRAERDFPAPGRLVEMDGRLSHVHCTGTGAPMILLESGLDVWGSTSWAGIRDELSEISRVCAYDRAGILWSEPRDDPRDAERLAGELHALLAAASEAPPFVMVGHSLGGVLVRVYDERYPGEAVGFVFVDPSHPEQNTRFPPELQERMALSDTDPAWLFRIVAPYRYFLDYFVDQPPTAETAYWWRSFPEGVLREKAAIAATFEQAGRTGSLGDRPLVVLSAGQGPSIPGVSAEANEAFKETLRKLHEELAALSDNSDHRIVEGSGHYVHQDQPQTVVSAIRDVVRAARNGAPVRREATEDRPDPVDQ